MRNGSPAALAAVAAEPPDVFITDIGMPHLNGFELGRQVRSLCGQTPLMIAVTGYADAQTREQCSKTGFDHFFVKPADPADILTVLREHADFLPEDAGAGSE